MTDQRITALAEKLASLRPGQLAAIEAAVDAFAIPVTVTLNRASDIATAEFGDFIGDVLQAHHASSTEGFTKDKFEHAMLRAMTAQGRDAALANRGNRGHDITVDGVPWSLKTQGNSSIDLDRLHISKFMELGRGRWEDESDLAALRDAMFEHMQSYDRILVMRHLSGNKRNFPPGQYVYELVEIPKDLLYAARSGRIEMMHGSRQVPKPGTCTVTDEYGTIAFQLYFDGGTERKLQVRSIRKDLCVVHATWAFREA